MTNKMIKPIPNWLSEDGETSRYQCAFCGTRKSVKYEVTYRHTENTFPCCNKCVLSLQDFH